MSRHDFQAPFTLPEGATEVVLVRHGASRHHDPDAVFGFVGGQADPPLSVLGAAQAERVAPRLAAAAPVLVAVSTLQRTAQTAAPLLERLGADPVVVPQLTEVHLGTWEEGGLGGTDDARAALRAEVLAAGDWGLIPGAEQMDAFATRVRAGLARVADAAGADAVAVAFTHGGVVAQACRDVTGARPFAFLATENASLTRLVRLAGGRWLLQSYNDTSHLSV